MRRERKMSNYRNAKGLTSISSLFSRSGASIMFLKQKFSFSISKWCLVRASSLSQCLCFIDLLAIISSRGQHSLKSSILFFNSLKASHSFKAFGRRRHLQRGSTHDKHTMLLLSSLVAQKVIVKDDKYHLSKVIRT